MSEPIVTMRNVSKRFGAKAALADISADVQAGDIIGVLGKNGAGKTTLLEVLLGFSPSNEGSAAVFGEDSMHLSAAAKAQIGFVPQQDELLAMLNGHQQLAIICGVSRELGPRARRPPRRRVERADSIGASPRFRSASARSSPC